MYGRSWYSLLACRVLIAACGLIFSLVNLSCCATLIACAFLGSEPAVAQSHPTACAHSQQPWQTSNLPNPRADSTDILLSQSLAVPNSGEFLPQEVSPGCVTDQPVSDRSAANRQIIARPIQRPIVPGAFGLAELTNAAGAIFSGTVQAITRHPANNSQPIETVAITFHVENAIRGTTPGEDFSISQWIGVWMAGQRYRVGERVLVFLYPPSKLGLTSTVGAELGRFRVDPEGRILLTAQHLSAFRRVTALGGRSRVSFRDFAFAVRQADGEE